MIPSVVGIMGDSIQSLRLVLKSLLSTKPWLRDPDVINMPWRGDKRNTEGSTGDRKPLSFGLMQNDGVVTPHPPIARALRIVVKAVQEAGHEVGSDNSLFASSKSEFRQSLGDRHPTLTVPPFM